MMRKRRWDVGLLAGWGGFVLVVVGAGLWAVWREPRREADGLYDLSSAPVEVRRGAEVGATYSVPAGWFRFVRAQRGERWLAGRGGADMPETREVYDAEPTKWPSVVHVVNDGATFTVRRVLCRRTWNTSTFFVEGDLRDGTEVFERVWWDFEQWPMREAGAERKE